MRASGGGGCCDVLPNREYQWRGINYKGECNRNSGVEKYNNWNLKFTGGAGSIVDLNCLKIGRLRLSSLRNRNKEGRRISKPTETCEAHQVDLESWKERRERERKNIWRNNDRKTSWILWKTIYTSKKVNELQIGETERDPPHRRQTFKWQKTKERMLEPAERSDASLGTLNEMNRNHGIQRAVG